MRALKLEAILPEAEARAVEKKTSDAARKAAFEDGYQQGFAAGAEASAAEHSAAQDVLRVQFVEALRDLEFTHAEARADVMRALMPLLETVVRRLGASLAEAAAPCEILRHVEAAIDEAPEAQMSVVCAPELVEGLRAALAGRALPVRIDPDPRLTPLEARVRWAEGFDHIDFDRALEQTAAALAQLRDQALGNDTWEIADAG